MTEPERRLAGILAADIVGYSRLLGQDEAASLGLLERLDEARVVVARIRAISPQFSIARARTHLLGEMNNPFGRIEVVDAFCDGLRRAGAPEA